MLVRVGIVVDVRLVKYVPAVFISASVTIRHISSAINEPKPPSVIVELDGVVVA